MKKGRRGPTKLNLERVTIFISAEMKEWYKIEASKMGLSMSALMATALYQHREQKEMMIKMQTDEFKDMLLLAKAELDKQDTLKAQKQDA